MALIIKDKIQMLKKGYPTVSDKYNVTGGILAQGSDPVQFGELVAFDPSAKGYYTKIKASLALSDANGIAGFVLATNVKTASWPGNQVLVYGGEAFNLLISGFIAVELDLTVTEEPPLAKDPVYVNLSNGKLAYLESSVQGWVQLPGCMFTGTYELKGPEGHPTQLLAEIMIIPTAPVVSGGEEEGE